MVQLLFLESFADQPMSCLENITVLWPSPRGYFSTLSFMMAPKLSGDPILFCFPNYQMPQKEVNIYMCG